MACRLLDENAKRNHWNLEIVNREFKLEDLTRTHDFMKMDGEGCEADLLKMKHNILKPCVIEAHSSSLVKDLQVKFNMRIIHTSPNGFSLLASTTSVSGD